MTIPPPIPNLSGDAAAGKEKSPPPASSYAPPLASSSSSKAPPKEPPEGLPPAEIPLLSSLRQLNAEMLDLQDVLTKVQKGDTPLATFAGYIQGTIKDVEDLLAAIKPLAQDPAISDTIRHIFNAWEKMKANPLMLVPDGEHEAQEQLHDLALLGEQTGKIIYLCCSLTIPNRLTEWLDSTRPEKYIPFNQVFEDEIPDPDARQRLLNLLAWGDKAVKNGYVDLDAGLIFRYSRSRRDRWMSVLYLLLGLALLTGIVAGACFLSLPGWVLAAANLTQMLSGWAALLIGVVVHISIGSIKHSRERGGLPAQFASSDIFFLINARLGQILLKLFIALVGFFALVFTSGISQLTLFNCFLVGYSLDSFVEMFGSSLEKSAAGQVSALQKQLGGE